MKILVVNPGSTSTKMAVYDDEKPLLLRNISHTAEQLAPFGNIIEQQDFRRQLILDELKQAGIALQFDAVIGRGGLVKPIAGGVYEINSQMLNDTLHGCVMHSHACNLGCLIAHEIASSIPGCRSFIADPGVVDELSPLARISGSPLMPRIAIWHALNQRAIARRYARGIGKEYEDLNLIICHLGGGISVAAHEHGRAIDALLKRIAGKAGLNAHLGTNDMREILERIKNGDSHAKLIVEAMLYHIAKNIAAESAVLCGNIDAILLTGGLAHSEYVVNELRRRVGFLAPVYCFPGEDEMEALALNALAVLQGRREAKVYE